MLAPLRNRIEGFGADLGHIDKPQCICSKVFYLVGTIAFALAIHFL